MKREGYISWEEYFMGIVLLAEQRSKDPNTQVGACIVKENKILGIGYNGFPKGLPDDIFPWDRGNTFLKSKYAYVCHAELNAIINSINMNILKGSTIYTSIFPCNECAKLIIQAGITDVVYLYDKYPKEDFTKAAKEMFLYSYIRCRQFKPDRDIITLNFKRGE
jgi:dCMP deaminase